MDLNKLNSVIEQFGTKIVDQMKAELLNNGNLASGSLFNSISYQYQVDAEQVLVQFLSNDYGEWVDKGREPGKYAPPQILPRGVKLKASLNKQRFLSTDKFSSLV